MKSFYAGFEKRANLLLAGGKALLAGAKTVARNPMKSAIGGLGAYDVASSASRASKGVSANRAVRVAGPYR